MRLIKCSQIAKIGKFKTAQMGRFFIGKNFLKIFSRKRLTKEK